MGRYCLMIIEFWGAIIQFWKWRWLLRTVNVIIVSLNCMLKNG